MLIVVFGCFSSFPFALFPMPAGYPAGADEFEANLLAPHWPPALYVRAARRLQGPRIFSQGTPEATRGKVGNLSIGIGTEKLFSFSPSFPQN